MLLLIISHWLFNRSRDSSNFHITSYFFSFSGFIFLTINMIFRSYLKFTKDSSSSYSCSSSVRLNEPNKVSEIHSLVCPYNNFRIITPIKITHLHVPKDIFTELYRIFARHMLLRGIAFSFLRLLLLSHPKNKEIDR